MTIIHNKISTVVDDLNSDLIRPSDWNANHTVFPHLHTHFIGEIPIKIIGKKYRTINTYSINTLTVYLNGLREKNIIEISDNEFEFIDDVSINDTILIDYIKIEA